MKREKIFKNLIFKNNKRGSMLNIKKCGGKYQNPFQQDLSRYFVFDSIKLIYLIRIITIVARVSDIVPGPLVFK